MLKNPIAEYQTILSWLEQHVGTTITPQRLVHRLGIFLNRRHPIQVKLEVNDTLDAGDVTVGALYDPIFDEEQRKPLILFLIVNYPKDHKWLITDTVAREIAVELTEALVHEYQHMHQYRSRGFILNRPFRSLVDDDDLRAEQDYLGNADEIDAYAANIAVKFFIHQDTQLLPISMDLGRYYRVFGSRHPVVKRLLKKIIRRLQELQNLNLKSQNILVKTMSEAERPRSLSELCVLSN